MMNYKDLDYDGLLSDRAIFYYSLFQYVSFLFAIVSFATIVTVIFKAPSNKIGDYRWLLLNEIFWNFLFDFLVSLWLPIPALPSICAFSGSPFFRNTSSFTSGLMTTLITATVGWKVVSMTSALVHRYIKGIVVKQIIVDVYAKISPWFQIGLCSLNNLYAIFDYSLPVLSARKINEQISLLSPTLKYLFDTESSLLCMLPTHSKTNLIISTFISGLIMIIQALFILHGFYKFKNDPRYKINKKTSALQMMLLKSVSIQYAVVIIFLAIPFFVVMYIIIMGLSNVNGIGIAMICITSMHSTIDCIIIICSIRPYREYVRDSFRRVFPNNTVTVIKLTNTVNRH